MGAGLNPRRSDSASTDVENCHPERSAAKSKDLRHWVNHEIPRQSRDDVSRTVAMSLEPSVLQRHRLCFLEQRVVAVVAFLLRGARP